MQINQVNINKSSFAFQSKFLRTEPLIKTLEATQTKHLTGDLTNNFQLLNAMKAIINDGKDNVFKLAEIGENFCLLVNGIIHSETNKKDYCNDECIDLIVDYAKEYLDVEPVANYTLWSDEELEFQKKQTEVFNMTPSTQASRYTLFKSFREVHDESVKAELKQIAEELEPSLF